MSEQKKMPAGQRRRTGSTPGKGAPKGPGAPTRPRQGSADDPVMRVAAKNRFYMDGAKTYRRFLPVSAALLGVSAVLLGISINKKSENRYIATYADGTLLQAPALDVPNHSEVVVRNWLSRALGHTFEMDYVHYKTQINRVVGEYFTQKGGSELIKSLVDSGFIDQMTNNGLAVSLVSLSDPVLVRHGNFGQSDYYAWLFQSSGLLTMQNRSERYDLPVSITVTVARRNTLEYPVGLGIDRIFVEMEPNP